MPGDPTQRMLVLLAALRRERNGLVADTMRFYGRPYGLNLGVSLPTVRTIARAEERDHAWARMLYRQEVRELRLAALWLADPKQVTESEWSEWGAGVVNSEVAEECAFALMSRVPQAERWMAAWLASDDELLQYAALMAAARTLPDPMTFAGRMLQLIASEPVPGVLSRGAVAFLSAAALKSEYQLAVKHLLASLEEGPSARYLRDELAWQLDS